MDKVILETVNLTKAYGSNIALSSVNLSFKSGIYGLLGRNGAGKSTLIKILTSLLTPGVGEILYKGKNINTLNSEFRNILGYVPQYQSLYPNMSVNQYLTYISALKAIKDPSMIDWVLNVTNTKSYQNIKIKHLSGGMKQRVMIAQALINNPKVLILDEPTAGLDPLERSQFRNLIQSIAQDRIIIIATHVVSDIEYIANRIIILKNGSVVLNDTQENCINATNVFEIIIDSNETTKFKERFNVTNIYNIGEGRHRLRILTDEPSVDMVKSGANLDDVFLKWV